MNKDIALHLERARFLARLLDARFNILGIHFGIDPLLSVIPSLGSIIGAATSMYLFWIGLQLKLPREIYTRMLVNILADFVLGSIPGVGIILDIFYKSNIRNLKMIEEYLIKS